MNQVLTPAQQEFDRIFKEFKERLQRSCGGVLSEEGETGTSNIKMLVVWLKAHGVQRFEDVTVAGLMRATTALFKEQKLVWITPPNLDQLAKVKNSANQETGGTALDQSGLGSTIRMVQNAADQQSRLKADEIDAKTKTEIETTWGRTHSRAKDFREQLKKLYDNLQAEPLKKGEAPHQKAERIQAAVLTLQKKLQDGK